MRLLRARVTGYRPIRDSGDFEIEDSKTILVGPNEAGKTALLRALQAISPPPGEAAFHPLRDFPRSEYARVQRGEIDRSAYTVVQAELSVDPWLHDQFLALDSSLAEITSIKVGRRLDNTRWVELPIPTHEGWSSIDMDVARLRTHVMKKEGTEALLTEIDELKEAISVDTIIEGSVAARLGQWLTNIQGYLDDEEDERFNRLRNIVRRHEIVEQAKQLVEGHLPRFVYYSQYFRVRPRIHLRQLAEREETVTVDPDYDFGNLCLLKLMGLTARQLADLGDVARPAAQDLSEQARIQDQLDERMYLLNASAVELTELVRAVWGEEDATLDIRVDGDYLKVVSRDELGVEVELDQKSEGFQWLVSFYTVFKAQSQGELANSILLLDEPGLSLHALKQQEFRKTVSKLAEDNQTIYTTHSPFMVGPDELPLVRVVEMKSRAEGTKVRTQYTADDPAALYPLQAALGYSLAQSLFAHQRNLVVEGITDYLYMESIASALREAAGESLDGDIAIVPAGDAGKVAYFAVLLRAQQLRVAALLDSDQAGDRAAQQDNLVALLTPHRIHRTKDYYSGSVARPSVEDTLRETLVKVARDELGSDISAAANSHPTRPLVDLMAANVPDFSKYRLAEKFVRWLAQHGVNELTNDERVDWTKLFAGVNKSLV